MPDFERELMRQIRVQKKGFHKDFDDYVPAAKRLDYNLILLYKIGI